MIDTKAVRMIVPNDASRVESRAALWRVRTDFYACRESVRVPAPTWYHSTVAVSDRFGTGVSTCICSPPHHGEVEVKPLVAIMPRRREPRRWHSQVRL
jgi:hypothetical protein